MSIAVQVSTKPLPYAILAAGALASQQQPEKASVVSVQFDHQSTAEPSMQLVVNGKQRLLEGTASVARTLARQLPALGLYGSSAFDASLIDYWVDFSQERFQTSMDFRTLQGAFNELNDHLRLRSFIVGYSLTLADLMIWSSLRSSNIWVRVAKGKDAPQYLLRWYNHIGSLPAFQTVNWKVPKASTPNAADPKGATNGGDGGKASGLADKKDSFQLHLDGARQGEVVTRFPPEPSGYLHIGHIKAAMLNYYMAKQYGGKMIIRFDDTNPSKEKAEFEESIMADLKSLGIHGDALTWTSDSFDLIYKLALDMIKKGAAYIDDTPLEEMRRERMEGLASKNRELSVEENLRRFEEMKNATEFGLTCCLRAKISVDAKNKALRDPVMYRCNLLPHNRTGRKWNIYPTYDFACPVVDSIEGVTHALRTNEYHDRNDQYYWFIEQMGLRKPLIWDYSRINFIYTLLSKRKLQWFVDKGLVSGWDDPRFPTVRGILRRGLTKEALMQFILMQGASKNTILLEWDKLWAINKQIIDPLSPRYVALNRSNICLVSLSNGPQAVETKSIPKHKKNPELGEKEIRFWRQIYLDADDAAGLVDGEEVTLMDWGNMIVRRVERNSDGLTTTGIQADLHLEGDFKKTKKKFTWLPALNGGPEELLPLQLVDYDFLITKKKLEEEDSVEDCVNPKTEFVSDALGDPNLRSLQKGDIIQLERRGFYICDQPAVGEKQLLRLIVIPDGKAASIGLKAAVATK